MDVTTQQDKQGGRDGAAAVPSLTGDGATASSDAMERVTWHVDDVDWTPLTGLFINKAGYKTVVPPEFTGNAYSIELTTVGTGGSSPTHVEPWAHVFYVLSGHGEVTVEDEIREVRPGSVSPIAAGQAHSFRNLGGEPLEMLVIYHPPRTRKKAQPAADRLTVTVTSVESLADSVVGLELQGQGETPLPPFEPGAHIDLQLPNGLVRSYSLCGAQTGRYRIAVLKDPTSRGGSAYVHEQLRPGAVLDISPPRNDFPLNEQAGRSVLIAGGIGITPILSMMRRLRELGRDAELLYAVRSRADAAFVAEIEALDFPVTWHFDDERGGPPDLESFLRGRSREDHFYACGPVGMLAAFEDLCARLGHPHAHLERFTAGRQPAPSWGAYEVRLARSGIDLQVSDNGSLLDALLEAGVAVPYSCRQGVCGTCKTTVLAGSPEHRDAVLSAQERTQGEIMTPCVSGCRSSVLVLDL